MKPPPDAATPFLVGFRAARANLVPGLCVQGLMLAVVIAYYQASRVRPYFDRLGVLKQNGGYLFSIASAVVAGAVLPALFKTCFLRRGPLTRRDAGDLLFAMGFWACSGLAVDTLYRWQTVWFGAVATPTVLVKKVVVDQFGFNPLFAAPFAVACYHWKNHGSLLRALAGIVTPRLYFHRVVPTLIATWMVWIPVVTALYSLPPLLQIPLFSLALSFWALMLAYIHAEPETGD